MLQILCEQARVQGDGASSEQVVDRVDARKALQIAMRKLAGTISDLDAHVLPAERGEKGERRALLSATHPCKDFRPHDGEAPELVPCRGRFPEQSHRPWIAAQVVDEDRGIEQEPQSRSEG